ncbi:MAG: PAS domain-containing protein, partial [Chlorobiales bacterium]|nr:PAS domain-containing protein [Chlorobiales bacterium]
MNTETPGFILKQGDGTLPLWVGSFSEAVFIIDPDGIIFQVNDAFACIFGKTPQEFVGSNIYDLASSDISLYRRKKVEEVLQSSKPLSWEDVRYGRHLRNTIYPMFTPNGEVEHLLIIAQDVTELKQTERSLISSNERLQIILAEAQGGIWEWDLSSNVNIWSDELWKLFGLE